MLDFHTLGLTYQEGYLALDQVRLDALARTYGTPLYVYSANAIKARVAEFSQAYLTQNSVSECSVLPVSIHYAVKANSNLSILQLLHSLGCGFDVVSVGELKRVLHIGASADKVIFSGIGKTDAELSVALQAGVNCINVESQAELLRLNQVAQTLNKIAPISVRVNPDVDAKTHPYIATGLKNNKFGVAYEDAFAVYQQAEQLSHIKIVGIDCHIGSQITELAPYLAAIDKVVVLAQALETQLGITLNHFDFGGGLGICYQSEEPPSPAQWVTALCARVSSYTLKSPIQIYLEPGRSIIANAGLLLTQAIDIKPSATKNFCIVDAAMNDLMRPALYGAYHQVQAVKQYDQSAKMMTCDIVGPVCESSDFLAKDRSIPQSTQSGDYFAVLSAGAYSFAMSSNYNTRARPAEVLIDQHQSQLIRKRESFEDLIALEQSS